MLTNIWIHSLAIILFSFLLSISYYYIITIDYMFIKQ